MHRPPREALFPHGAVAAQPAAVTLVLDALA
jgi:hypothetical protein